MLNVGPRGGWGAGANSAPPNPFESATPVPGNPFTKPLSNPFLQSNGTKPQASTKNPFDTSATAVNPFARVTTSPLARSVSPFSKQITNGAAAPHNPFEVMKQGTSAPGVQLPRSAAAKPRRSSPEPTTNGPRRAAEFVQPAWPTESNASKARAPGPLNTHKRKDGFGAQGNMHNGANFPAARDIAGKQVLGSGFDSNSSTMSHESQNGLNNHHDGRSYELANKVKQQLSKDRIKPPQWPSNPGSHAQRQAMETFRESYKTYREKARKSLIRAGLIDDPDQRRTLEQALDFRGISEEMCPEWEKITRIIEYDVRNPEKAPDDSGDLVAIPSLMVKRLARSAAGQDAPLPMDVRSFATLRKCLDYLIDDLIPDDSFLPSKHNFLWDRTRAIRIDLSVQKYNLTPDERTDLVYCLETIARFHVTALHLLSQDGFAAEDFSEQQEIEQLGKTLISLKELYDDCVEQGIECANEAEFRGYYIVFNARNPSIKETVEGWGTRLWNTDGIRTAMCLVESLQNTWILQGPLHPSAATELALGAAGIFFSIVSSPQISYTMACFAEIHFNDVRKTMLHILRKAYTRPRDGPKDITPAYLKARLRFDTEDEAVEFAGKHGIMFGQDGLHRYAILNSRQPIEEPRIRHTFSRGIVEHKRSGRSLPDIIHRTTYQRNESKLTNTGQEESLFVTDEEDASPNPFNNLVHGNKPNISGLTISPGPPIATSTSSLKTEHYDLAQNKATTISPTMSHPGQTPQPPTATTSIFTAPTPIQDSNLGTARGLFNQSQASPVEANTNALANDGERSQLNIMASTQIQNNTKTATPNGSTSAVSNSTASPSIFSFLNNNNKGSPKPTESQANPILSLGTPAKPSLFPSGDGGGKLVAATTGKPPTAVSSSLLESSSASSQLNNSDKPSDSSLFRQTSPMAVPGADGASFRNPNPFTSSKPSTNSSPTGQRTSTPNRSASSAGLSPTLSRPELGTPNATKRTSNTTTGTTVVSQADAMGNFTRWFVLADKGLMQEVLEPLAVEHVLRSTWKEFQDAEADRIRREADEKSWADALDFRHRSLQITFFYRWLDITRKRRVVKRIRLEKEKARKWNSPQSVREREIAEGAKKEKAIREAKELVGRRTKRHTQELARMQESTMSQQSLEDALLATSVFSGAHDERTAAHHIAQDGEEDNVSLPPVEQLRLRSENQRRRKRGLPPLKRYLEGKSYKEGSKTAMLRAISSGAGRDTLSLSTGSLRNSTFSSSYRSSLGFNQNRVAKSRSNVSDPYWRMRANGLVQMPNGEYLHETLALPMLREGKRFPGLGDYGLPPEESFTPSQSPPSHPSLVLEPESPTPARFLGGNRVSRSPSILDGASQKRKRGEAEDEDLAAYRNEAPASQKRTKSGDRATKTIPSADQDFLDSIANLLNKVNAATNSSTP